MDFTIKNNVIAIENDFVLYIKQTKDLKTLLLYILNCVKILDVKEILTLTP